ncbi:MAG: phosphoribosylformylglycinamidine synthase subunit PurL [Candidatus Zixiibacteriota bacterium]|nr:MAG: phosphoribosylformylglycinamidine synthase subunit PurL [candidate division Zixibacteria bacterium]
MEPTVDLKLVKEHGLSEEEYQTILDILGRTPTFTELGIFSVMWSEHCSYKNSIAQLKTLPREGTALLAKAGEENAGAIDIGDGLAVVFKIESHNHPSAVEPYQGAATGVGGILRDIFTMGARPVAVLNSLHFGSLENPRVRYLFDGVIRGIGDYGNCFGVPDIGGEIYFEEAYTGNPLVNAMAVGIAKHSELVSAVSKGEGNIALMVGASTGRDGIHGATFASEELSEKSEARRPSVQIGDPFMEKLLLEATLEIIREKLIVGIQDMGAAGITCSSSEMSARGKSGMRVDIDQVPVREEGMTPYEIMLSESQERMLVVCEPDKLPRVKEIFRKWGLHAKEIGEVISGGNLVVRNNGDQAAEIPANILVLGGGAPVYVRPAKKPDYIDEHMNFNLMSVPSPGDWNKAFKTLLSSPNIASKRWVYEQYDTSVRTSTAVRPGSSAGVIRIRKTDKAIAVTTDCNGRYCYLDPRMGAKIAVAEAAMNVAVSGAKPAAITNCLNFGNPYDPEIYYQFTECVAGMGEACRTFDTPVTGGNVSFYNEDPERAVYPTPVIGMVGIIEHTDHITTIDFKAEGHDIFLIGDTKDEIGGTEYLKTVHGKITGRIPEVYLEHHKNTINMMLELIKAGVVISAQDVSDGGLAVALAECCFKNGIGADVTIESDIRPDALLFGETQSRAIFTADPNDKEKVWEIYGRFGVPVKLIGHTGGKLLKINNLIDLPVADLRDIYENAIPSYMGVVAGG